jgi:Flp pilus assembly protein TadD
MAGTGVTGAVGALRKTNGLLTAICCCLMLAACSKSEQSLSEMLAAQNPAAQKAAAEPATASITTGATTPVTDGKAELAKATEYWGKIYAKNPKDAQTALNFARKPEGAGREAAGARRAAAGLGANPNHKGIAGEYGRLLLEFNHITQAEKLLEQADDPSTRIGRWSPRAARRSPSRTSTARPCRCSSGPCSWRPISPR